MKNLINRQRYKEIKRYDHNQMEKFAKSLYESGIKDGANAAAEQLKSEEKKVDQIEKEILEIKGIGKVKVEKIMEIINKAVGE